MFVTIQPKFVYYLKKGNFFKHDINLHVNLLYNYVFYLHSNTTKHLKHMLIILRLYSLSYLPIFVAKIEIT
jgi:hypothetical protein